MTATDGFDRIAASAELCKRGDMSERHDLFEQLLNRDLDDQQQIMLQRLVLSIATEREATDPRLVEYAWQIQDSRVSLEFAASGRWLLVRDVAPLYLDLAQTYEEIRSDFFHAATGSAFALSGVEFDEFSDEATVADFGVEVMAALGTTDAPYMTHGAPFHPASTIEDLTAGATRAQQTGRLTGVVTLELLATWSGVPHPQVPERAPSEDDVRAIVDYTVALSRLPWRPGVKYFHGHDVDGGPGLHAAT